MTAGLILFILLLSPGGVLAATVHGTVYEWDSFEPLENVLVEVNSTPVQSYVAADAIYAFNLSSGNYLITARYFEGDSLKYTARESVIISEDGDYVLDILLFPEYEEELLEEASLEDFGRVFEEDEIEAEEGPINSVSAFLLPALLLLLFLLFAGVYFLKEKKSSGKDSEKSSGKDSEKDIEYEKPSLKGPLNSAEVPEIVEKAAGSPEEASGDAASGSEVSGKVGRGEAVLNEAPETASEGSVSETPEPEKLPPKEPVSEAPAMTDPDARLPEDLRELMGLIRAGGNRITQKELRKKSPYSESKVSLMLSDLEERGLVEKFKKGRGNIIRIPDRHIRPPEAKPEKVEKPEKAEKAEKPGEADFQNDREP